MRLEITASTPSGMRAQSAVMASVLVTGAERHHVFVGSLISHHTDTLDRQQYCQCLPNLIIQPSFLNFCDEDFIGFAKNIQPLPGNSADNPDSQTGTWKRMPPKNGFRDA